MIRRYGKHRSILLFCGDFLVYFIALWLTLVIRYWEIPSWKFFSAHLYPFSIIFLLWAVVFFIADLYGREVFVFNNRLPQTVINAQLAGSFLAVLFFYYLPFFQITPKLTLFLDLILSLLLIFSWRLYGGKYLRRGRREIYFFRQSASTVISELKSALLKKELYNIEVVDYRGALSDLRPDKVSVLVLDFYDSQTIQEIADCYRLMMAGVQIISAHRLYEELFGRIPLSMINEQWFLEYIETNSGFTYRMAKRVMDFVVSLLGLILSLPFYIFIVPAIFLNDSGPIFYREGRVGRGGKIFQITKFRSMTTEKDLSARQVTFVGRILRRTRLDELPQLWSVLVGDQSLIGPRPERPEYVEIYKNQIPYYHARHLISPGLSGWAQIYHENHPHFQLAIEATRDKLSYDLYYVKNRSLWLDITIALKTIKTLLSQVGV